MALLTSSAATALQASTTPSLSTRQHSELAHRHILKLGSAFRSSDKLTPAICVFAQRILHHNQVALAYLVLGCRIAVLQSLLVAKDLATMSVTALSKAVWGAWNSKQSRRLRKKLEYEFFVMILGSGNGIILVMFWPGWILIGLVYLVYLLCSWAG